MAGQSTIIRSETFGLIQEALDIVVSARGKATTIDADCQSVYEASRREGFDVGRREGMEVIASHLAAALTKAEHDLLDIEDRIYQVVFKSIGMVLGELEPTERMRLLVKKALVNVTALTQVTLRTSAQDETVVKAALEGIEKNIVVIVDPYAAVGQITIETDGTRSQIGLADQLAALMEAIHSG